MGDEFVEIDYDDFRDEDDIEDDGEFAEFLDENRMEATYDQMQNSAVVTGFCTNLNPGKTKDKPFIKLCKIFNENDFDGDDIVKELYKKDIVQFLNPKYLSRAIIFNTSDIPKNKKEIKKVVEANKFDLADFIRYLQIVQNIL